MSKATRRQNQPSRDSVAKIITIIRYDVPASNALPMATLANSTVAAPGPPDHAPWLWIPYVLIALVFIVFLGANFWCYHKKHRERYLRKREETRVKEGLLERRRITALVRSHFQAHFLSISTDLSHPPTPTRRSEETMGSEQKIAKPASSTEPEPPVLDQWAGQNGLCRTLSMCGIKTES
ncbi:uncharacterized protein LOC112562657 [Pomacea canaliculata]|uniref:uncharacterized protein LOC112562657 n=1 Tax=Pomacea canaliculata TaxID=400727 RepID=UPI000D72E757|nr:uncharacterized protein LOC112562657 [Pomacea canaliculata]